MCVTCNVWSLQAPYQSRSLHNGVITFSRCRRRDFSLPPSLSWPPALRRNGTSARKSVKLRSPKKVCRMHRVNSPAHRRHRHQHHRHCGQRVNCLSDNVSRPTPQSRLTDYQQHYCAYPKRVCALLPVTRWNDHRRCCDDGHSTGGARRRLGLDDRGRICDMQCKWGSSAWGRRIQSLTHIRSYCSCGEINNSPPVSGIS